MPRWGASVCKHRRTRRRPANLVPVSEPARVLVVDALDSFTGSLVQQLLVLGASTTVVRGELPSNAESYDLIVLSPGPGRPEDHPAHLRAARERPAPIFGVCLGMQAIALALGGEVAPARRVVHGRTSSVYHDGRDIFAGIPSPMRATRYHSLAVYGLPPELRVTARTGDGQAMALAHRFLPVCGVQFHPESVRTRHGLRLLANVLARYPRRR